MNQRLKLLSQLVKLNTVDLFYGFREANELENGSGKLTLSDNQLSNVMPLHIYPLSSIINNGVTPPGGYVLKTNGYDFASLGSIEFMGAKGAISASPTTQELPSLLHRYSDIRMLFWSSAKRKTNFRVSLVKIF